MVNGGYWGHGGSRSDWPDRPDRSHGSNRSHWPDRPDRGHGSNWSHRRSRSNRPDRTQWGYRRHRDFFIRNMCGYSGGLFCGLFFFLPQKLTPW